MKILFWIATFINIIATYFIFQGFVNIYYKNYNGGPESSSGSIKYVLILALVILLAGAICYFTGHIKLAAAVMGLPIVLVLLYMFFVMILPLLLGGRMN